MQKIKKTNIGLDLRKCLQSSVLFDWNGRTRCMPFWDGPGAGLLNNSLGSLDFQITHKYPSEQDENSCLFNRGHTSFWDIFCAICVNSWIVVKDKVQEIRWFTMDFFNKKKFFRKNSNVCLIHLMVVKLLTDIVFWLEDLKYFLSISYESTWRLSLNAFVRSSRGKTGIYIRDIENTKWLAICRSQIPTVFFFMLPYVGVPTVLNFFYFRSQKSALIVLSLITHCSVLRKWKHSNFISLYKVFQWLA